MSTELVEFLEQYIGSDYIIKESSGRSRIYVTPLFAIKIFGNDIDITIEANAIAYINSEFLIKIYKTINDISIKAIVYETVTPITKINGFNNHDIVFFKILLCSVAHALYDMHSKGYKHGDVARGNIGVNDAQGIVVYDTEDLEPGTEEQMFNDAMMFVEDMEGHYKHTENEYITTTLGNIKSELSICRRFEECQVVLFGRTRTRSRSIVEYTCENFIDLVINFIDGCSR